MKMMPIYSSDGHLQGHVDILACPLGRNGVHIPDTQDGGPQAGAPRAHSIPTRSLKISIGEARTELTFLVSDDIPDWVWKSGRAVKFTEFRR